MSSTSLLWQVQIQGSQSDLEHLERHYNAPPTRVLKDALGPGFLYESASFAACASSENVLAIAEAELSVLSGALKFAKGSYQPLSVGAVFRSNGAGGRDAFVHLRDSLQVRVEFGEPTVRVFDPEGKDITPVAPPPRTVLLARLALTDHAVAKALRLHASADSKSWVGLYRLYEVIEDDVGGQEALKKRSWGLARDQRRFKHSANSVAVGGDSARHGKELQQPPKHPMSLEEAAGYVAYVFASWLSAKGA